MTPEELVPHIARAYLSVLAVGFFVLILAEAAAPLVEPADQRQQLVHIGRNFGIWLATLLIGDVVFGNWILGFSTRLFDPMPGLLHGVAMPFPVLVIVGILAADLGEYVFHRLAHRYRLLWLVHAVHHSDDQVDVSTGLRFHPGETVFNLSWKLGLFWALGLPLWLVAARGLLMAPFALAQHANVRVPHRLDRALQSIFVTPAMHRVHHSPRAEENNTNFGEIFSLWDRLGGTYRASTANREPKYGLARLSGERWQTVRGMLATPVTARSFPSL